MMKIGTLSVLILCASVQISYAGGEMDPMLLAEASGVCGELGVASATYQEDGSILAECNEDVVAFIPFLLPAALATGAVALLAASSDNGSATPSTLD